MRPTARMPKLTRRSRILILIALGVIVLLLAGPRLIDAYVDWLWFGELGYRSVFTTVLVTRFLVFLVAGLLVGGIVFAGLAVVDKLTTGDLAGSKFIAGTGTISVDGKVGQIGGITHKMAAAHSAGATVFLVPAKNCYEATSDNPSGLRLVKVETLGQAVDALHAITSGGQAPSC